MYPYPASFRPFALRHQVGQRVASTIPQSLHAYPMGRATSVELCPYLSREEAPLPRAPGASPNALRLPVSPHFSVGVGQIRSGAARREGDEHSPPTLELDRREGSLERHGKLIAHSLTFTHRGRVRPECHDGDSEAHDTRAIAHRDARLQPCRRAPAGHSSLTTIRQPRPSSRINARNTARHPRPCTPHARHQLRDDAQRHLSRRGTTA